MSPFSVLSPHILKIYLFNLVLFIIKDHLVLLSTQDVLRKAFASREVQNFSSSSPKNSCCWGIFDKTIKSWQKREQSSVQ